MKKHTIIDDLDDYTELKIRKKQPILRTHMDTVLEWLPSALAAVVATRQSKSTVDFLQRAAVGLLALGLQKGTTHLIKQTTHHFRPNPLPNKTRCLRGIPLRPL